MKRRQPLFHCRTIGESAEYWQWIDNDTDDIFQSKRINKYLTNVYRDIQNLIFYAYWMNEYTLYIVIVFGPEKKILQETDTCVRQVNFYLSAWLTLDGSDGSARVFFFSRWKTRTEIQQLTTEILTERMKPATKWKREIERERERRRDREREKHKRRKERYRERENENSRQWSDDSFCRPPEILIREDPSEIFFFKALFSKRQTKRDERKT